MKVHKLSSVKILACFLLGAFCLKILTLINFTADINYRREISSKFGHKNIEAHATPVEQQQYISQPANEQLELVELLLKNANKNWSYGNNCAPYPNFKDIYIERDHYQFTLGGNVSYYFFGAYYDRRQALEDAPKIAILAMISSIFGPFEKTYCQLWYEDSDKPDIVEMTRQEVGWYDDWGNGPDHVYPVLMSCPLTGSPRRHRVPQLVSVVFEDRCERAQNALRVIYEAPQRKRATRFAVCLKDLDFPDADMSDRWVEWLELMRLLGAERVVAYDVGGKSLLQNTRRTLKHYTHVDGLLQLRKHQLLEGHPEPAGNYGLTRRLNEVLMYMDCFYRNLYQFDYVTVQDVDEVLMPLGELQNWTALLELLERNSTLNEGEEHCKARASYCFRNVYYAKDLEQDETVPPEFYMLRHVRRVANHLDANSAIKCLHSTSYVDKTHNHFPFSWAESCGPYDVPTFLGQMQHYREPDDKDTLQEPPPKRDDNIWRHKKQLMSNALAVHRQLARPTP